MKKYNIAVILAGGKGARFGSKLPKQFTKIAGKSIIEHTIERFQDSDEIDEIAVVMNPDFIDTIEEMVNKNMYNKVRKILKGGTERSSSSISAIDAYYTESKEKDINLIFHDAVRPFVSQSIINDVIISLDKYNAIDVAIPATDTIIEINEDNIITNVPQRSKLRRGQTPQAFKYDTIYQAYELAKRDPNFTATDDCGVVLKYLPEEKIYVVEGSEENIKVTYEMDMFIADKLFQFKNREFSNDTISNIEFEKIKNKVVVVFGGSYGIGKDIVDIFKQQGIIVHSFSRSENNVDVSNRADVASALKSVYEKGGRIDYVINTAAILNKQGLANVSNEDVDMIINVNYKGMINVAKESFRYLNETKGHLLLYTSSSYTRGRSSYSLYSSTKAAAVNFTQAIAEEWIPFGIQVNCINPERTKTPMRVKNFGVEPENTLLSSMEVAKTSVKTLMSDFTGQVVYVKRK
ncbi:MAG: 2-C-methyl-D-erythritol 4-phosphate cytidylyltransferase [Marinifilaceae bacterium]|jgi:2-C-methyl-D-erythritol 4-phosphate cytidylyltransferase|nr:2-C-methyl-D-erythritol 4-phosphate cytidylyltransferase [Marinifilaceae bacterium]